MPQKTWCFVCFKASQNTLTEYSQHNVSQTLVEAFEVVLISHEG